MADSSKHQQLKQSITTLIQAGELDQAKVLIENALESNADDIELWMYAAHIHTNLNDLDAAIADYQSIIHLGQTTPDNYNNLGYLLQEHGDVDAAITSYRKALELDEKHTGATFNLARAFAKSGNPDSAVHYYRIVLKRQPELTDAHINLANILRKSSRPEDAITSYKNAIKTDHGSFLAHLNLADLYEKLHLLDEAEHHVELAIKQQPESQAALLLLAKIYRRMGNLEQSKYLLEKTLVSRPPPVECAQTYNELGKTLEALELYDNAFKSFANANKIWNGIISGTHADTNSFNRRIDHYHRLLKRTTAAQWIATPTAPGSNSPVFLVGFPRSGTTLTEQILAAHPRVESSDEHPFIQHIINAIPEVTCSESGYPECVPDLSASDVKALSDRYRQLAREYMTGQPEDVRFIDKLPLNIVDIGLIHRMFPDARFIVAIRDPRDVCLSCFSQSFMPNQAMVNFLDIEKTASLYSNVMSLWLRYRSTLPLNWIEVKYEDLVMNTPVTAKHMLEFIGEEWDKSVLEFYSRSGTRVISTPSYEGVSSPIYTSAIGKWKNYKEKMKTAMPILEPYIIEFGYN